jgi:quinoprotein dehydrogenase-associated probable ABC transporter substrate-binding protein
MPALTGSAFQGWGRKLVGAVVAALVGAVWVGGGLVGGVLTTAAPASAQTVDLVSDSQFRVCADPANMPFSNEAGEGFENKIAELIASKLELPVAYTWFPQAIGFVRRTIQANRCDVIIGFAQGHELVLNTNHYYVSSYVLITKPDSDLADVETLADPRLQGRKIGVTAGTPPATHLARHGLIGDAKGYRLMVDRRVDAPAVRMMEDLASGEIDAGVLWGPLGGFHAKESGFTAKPLLAEEGAPRLFYRITMGVRQGEVVWKRKLNRLIRRNQAEIDAILAEYGVPLIDDQGTALKAAAQ